MASVCLLTTEYSFPEDTDGPGRQGPLAGKHAGQDGLQELALTPLYFTEKGTLLKIISDTSTKLRF